MGYKYKDNYKEILKKYGYTYIDGEYLSVTSKLKCYDDNGYIVYPCLDKLFSNKRPRIVDKTNPSSIYNINRYLLLFANNEYECISEQYIGNTELLKIIHRKCGCVFEKSWINISRNRFKNSISDNKTGALCPFCEMKNIESSHALVLKQVWLYEYPDTITEDKSCINPLTNHPLPTDIVNHNLKIAIEIQSWFHDFKDQQEKDEIKRNFWINKGYSFYALDQRDYTILEMINVFFKKYTSIPEYIDFHYSNKINDVEIQKLLNNGIKVPQIADIVRCNSHCIYDAIRYGRISYPYNYINACKQSIVQLDINGNLIQEFESISDAIKQTNSKNISRCLNSHRNFSNGYYWVKKEEYDSGNYQIKEYRSNKFIIPVDKYDLDNNFIQHYDTIISASKDNNCSNTDILRVMNGERNQCKGFIWKPVK